MKKWQRKQNILQALRKLVKESNKITERKQGNFE